MVRVGGPDYSLTSHTLSIGKIMGTHAGPNCNTLSIALLLAGAITTSKANDILTFCVHCAVHVCLAAPLPPGNEVTETRKGEEGSGLFQTLATATAKWTINFVVETSFLVT